MNALVPLALFGWIPVVLLLFALLPKQRAVIAAFLIAWLFLPVVHDPVFGIRWTKMRATCYGVMLAVLLYDSARLLAYRLRWYDVPTLFWCLCPAASSLANGLGLYDGISQSLDQTATWGLPYLIGRIYLGTLAGMREMALGVVFSGLVYVPLCLIEIKMSPQLHTWVYGYFQHQFGQTIRFGGYRPVVFMDHGLAVGAWMTTASLTMIWMWRTQSLVLPQWKLTRNRWLMLGLVCVLGGGTILCKSSGALLLGVAGLVVLYLSVRFRLRFLVILLMLIPVAYVVGRVWGGWSGMEVTRAISDYFDKERAQSVSFRFDNEDLLIGRAMGQPVFGWGGWGRSRVFDLDGKDLTVADGLWIIALGDRGMVGLVMLGTALALPMMRLLWLFPPRRWKEPAVAPAAVLGICLLLYMLDGLANAMINPVFMIVAGGLSCLDPRAERPSKPQYALGNYVNPAPPRARCKYPRSPRFTEATAPATVTIGANP